MRPVTLTVTGGQSSAVYPPDHYTGPFNVALGATAPFCDVI